MVEPKGLCDLMPAHRRYLKGRGFDPDEIVRLWHVRALAIHSKLAWRLYIPIQFEGSTVSWTTRSITRKGLRYVSASTKEESVPHKQLLYGEDYCSNIVVITEGPLDVWRIGPGAVATCGLGYTRAQLLRMAKYPVRAVCLDSDAQAQKRAAKLADELCAFPGDTYNIELDAEDAGAASHKQINSLRKELGL